MSQSQRIAVFFRVFALPQFEVSDSEALYSRGGCFLSGHFVVDVDIHLLNVPKTWRGPVEPAGAECPWYRSENNSFGEHSTWNWSSKTHPEQSAVVTLSKTCAQPIIMCWNEIVEYYAPLWRAVLGHRFLLGPFHRDYRFQLYVCVCVYVFVSVYEQTFSFWKKSKCLSM